MLQTVILEIKNEIAIITINRPQAMNTFDEIMSKDLLEVTQQVRDNSQIRAVLLKGAGSLFMAGGDLQFFHNNLSNIEELVLPVARRLSATIINLMEMPKPVLCAVHGSVAGVGLGLIMAADLVIAAENTKFTTAYASLGASADGGLSYNLPRHVGVKKAMELLFLPEVFDAATAQSIGLINWIVAPQDLEASAEKILQKLATGPTKSFAQIKTLVNQSWEKTLKGHLENEGHAFKTCAMTEDFKEGVHAFLAKRKPQFKGK